MHWKSDETRAGNNNYWHFRAGQQLGQFLPIASCILYPSSIHITAIFVQRSHQSPGGGEGRMTGRQNPELRMRYKMTWAKTWIGN